MATRVNTKFVVILSAGLLIGFCAVAAGGYVALKGRPARWVAKADGLMDRGEYREAAKLYERAVGHDRTRMEWLERWLSALVKTTPDNRARYEEQYGFYRNILRTMGELQRTDPEPQLRYIQEVERVVRRSGAVTRDGLEMLIREVTDHARNLDPEDPGTKRLLAYRGAAQAERMMVFRVDEEERKQALQDIEGAIAVDPSNVMARIAEMEWHRAEAERYRAERRPELEAGPRAKVDELREKLLIEMPENPEVLLACFTAAQSDKLRIVRTPEERMWIVQGMKTEMMGVIDAAIAADPATLSVDLVDSIVAYAIRAAGNDAVPSLMALVDQMLTVHPKDARLLLNRGLLLQQQERIDEAVAVYQQVIDLPDLPVSLDGLMLPSRRMSAMAYQIDCAIVQWNRATTPEDRAAALARAAQYRERLAREVGVRGRDALLLRDAKIAYARAQWDEVVAKLSELRGMGNAAGRSVEALQILSQALLNQGNFGEARMVLNELVEVAPMIAWGHASLGEANLRSGRLEEAISNFQRATMIEPDNDEYQMRLATVRTALGGTADSDRLDPVLRTVLEVRRHMAEGDLLTARRIAEAAMIEMPDQGRIVQELVSIDMREGDREAARQRTRDFLKRHPDDARIRSLNQQLEIEDPVEAALAMIEAAEGTPAEKALARFNLFIQARRDEDAAAALAEAERLEPENPQVLDIAFVTALSQRDFQKAQRLAQTAARLNIDQLGGLLYQGRLEMIEGETRPEKMANAVATLENAVRRVPLNPTVRKLLAQAYQRAGRLNDAVEAFRRAYEGKEDDMSIARDYAGVLLALNRGPEALRVVSPNTGILRFHPTNREMQSLWMELESRFGDRSIALNARRGLYRADRGNTANATALAQMLIDDKRWDEAARVLNELDADPAVTAKLTIARLRSELLARQGDIEGGKKIIQTILADESLEPRARTSAYLALADFLKRWGNFEDTAAAMRQAVLTQDPVVMEGDRSLGDLYFDRANSATVAATTAEDAGDADRASALRQDAQRSFEQSIIHYEKVAKAIENQPEQAALVRKRMAETYIRLQRYDDAARIVDVLARSEKDDLQILLLNAAIAAGKNDRRGARQFYDRAVTLHQAAPEPYLQRALYNMSIEDNDGAVRRSLAPDILLDLKRVNELRPTIVAAWTKRYSLLLETGQVDQAFAVLRSAVDANPDNDDLRLMLIRELAMAGRLEEMQSEILATVASRPTEPRWLGTGARILAAMERWQEAARLYEQFYEKDPNPELAVALLDAHLRPGNNPERARIQQLLTAADSELKPDLLFDVMLKARARAYTNQAELSERHLDEALAIVGQSGPAAQAFMNYLILTRGSPSAAIEWLRGKARRGPINPYLETVILSARRASEPPSQIIEPAKASLARAADDMTRTEILRLLSSLYYVEKNYRLSADAAQQAIEIFENDPSRDRNPAYMELLNNLAYTLVAHLDDGQKAIPYAVKAATLSPNSATVLDTLGWCYYRTGDYQKAAEVLARAASLARAPNDVFICSLHLGLAQVKVGDLSAARRALRDAEQVADRADSSRNTDYAAQLQELRKSLE